MQKKLTTNQIIVTAFLFIVFYSLLFILSSASKQISSIVSDIPILNLVAVLPEFESPMFWLMPVVGFFVIFLLVDWVNQYFETEKALSVWFPLLLVMIGFLAFSVSLYFYYGNFAAMKSNEQQSFIPYLCYAHPDDCGAIVNEFNASGQESDGRQLFYVNVPFWGKLRSSAYYLFLLAGICGWLSRYVVEKLNV